MTHFRSSLVVVILAVCSHVVYADGWLQSDISASSQRMIDVCIGAGRNDGVKRVYSTTLSSAAYEVSWGGSSWSRTTIGPANASSWGIVAGDGKNTGINNIYLGSEAAEYEFVWNGLSWDRVDMGGGGAFCSDSDVGDGRNDGIKRVYLACSDDNVYEFTWNGTTWDQSTVGSTWGDNKDIVIGDGRNDGVNRLYVASTDKSVYEFTWSGGVWNRIAIGAASSEMWGVALGKARNDGVNRVYASNADHHLYEFSWIGIIYSKTDIGVVSPGGVAQRIVVGAGRNDNVNRVYTVSSVDAIYECSFDADVWNIRSFGPPSNWGIALGEGRNDSVNRLYVGNNDGRLQEYSYNHNPVLSWTGEPGYLTDGLAPSVGLDTMTYTYRATYTDADNDAPQSGYPRVHVKSNGAEIAGSPFAMSYVTGTSSAGAVYAYSTETVTPGNAYTYTFEAFDVRDGSATGTTDEMNGPEIIRLSPSTPFAGEALSTGTIAWSWTDNSQGETGYAVLTSTSGQLQALAADATTWLETGLSPNTQYSRCGVSMKAPYQSAISNVAYRHTLANGPTGLTKYDVSFTSAVIGWNDAGASRYAVERSTGIIAPLNWQLVRSWTDGVVGASFTDTSLPDGTTYWYRIKSYNADGVINNTGSNELSIYLPSLLVDHYDVIVPTAAVAGQAFAMTIKAKNNTGETLNSARTVAISALLGAHGSQAGTGTLGIVSSGMTDGTAELAHQSYVKAESIRIKAIDSQAIVGISGLLTVSAAAPATVTASAVPQTITAGKLSTITATVKDAYGNPVQGASVSLQIAYGTGSLSSSTALTDSNGQIGVMYSDEAARSRCTAIAVSVGSLSQRVLVNVAVSLRAGAGASIVSGEDVHTRAIIPQGAINADVEVLIKTLVELTADELGKIDRAYKKSSWNIVPAAVRSFAAQKNDGTDYGNFAEYVDLEIPYSDDNNDDIVDGTSISVNDITMVRLDPVSEAWQRIGDGGTNVVDKPGKVVRAQVRHFSIYSLGVAVAADLDNLRVFPNPVDFSKSVRGTLKFDNLSRNTKITIYDVTGRIVRTLNPGSADNDGTSGKAQWNGRNEAGEQVGMGLYVYLIVDEAGHKKTGKIGVTK